MQFSRLRLAAHAVSLGAEACKAVSLAELESALSKMRTARRTSVAVITTDPALSTSVGGAWWNVAIPEVSNRPQVVAARAAYDAVRERRSTQD
jgi:3D-(3,5/4)-trihydroxycyclohexane-1,2-dione acylhydrolase (decyclizing)